MKNFIAIVLILVSVGCSHMGAKQPKRQRTLSSDTEKSAGFIADCLVSGTQWGLKESELKIICNDPRNSLMEAEAARCVDDGVVYGLKRDEAVKTCAAGADSINVADCVPRGESYGYKREEALRFCINGKSALDVNDCVDAVVRKGIDEKQAKEICFN